MTRLAIKSAFAVLVAVLLLCSTALAVGTGIAGAAEIAAGNVTGQPAPSESPIDNPPPAQKETSESFCQGGAWIFFILLTQILSLLLPE